MFTCMTNKWSQAPSSTREVDWLLQLIRTSTRFDQNDDVTNKIQGIYHIWLHDYNCQENSCTTVCPASWHNWIMINEKQKQSVTSTW